MRHLIAWLLIAIAAFPAGAAASQSSACEDVAAYFAQVDAAIDEGMATLDALPGFRDAFEAADTANEQGGSGFLALPDDAREALLAYLRMPGEALAAIDAEDIPDESSDLHGSAVAYWSVMPEMMQAIADESPSAAMPFLADLETASGENVAAQEALIAACPDDVTAWADAFDRLSDAGPGTPAADLLSVWDQLGDDDPEGLGYPVLFLDNDDDAATPAASLPVSTRRAM